MIIPKGKKFQFRSFKANESTTNINLDSEVNEYLPDADVLQGLLKVNSYKDSYQIVPSFGYKGNAYLGQDVNLSFTSNFSKPLEGILDKIPHTVDLVVQGKTGTSVSNARFLALKYWTGNEPLEISLQLIFETQIDSYYDVYVPVINLCKLVLPEENDLGFYDPPSPTLSLIAGESTKFAGKGISFINDKLASTEADKKRLAGMQTAISGRLEDFSNNIKRTGFINNLYIGNNFEFKNIIITSVQPTFSSELCYAPIKFLNDINSVFAFNPNTSDPGYVKLLSQTICAVSAGIGSLSSSLGLPDFLAKMIQNKLNKLPSYPIRAEVNITFETFYPVTKNDDDSPSSIRNLFTNFGDQKLYD